MLRASQDNQESCGNRGQQWTLGRVSMVAAANGRTEVESMFWALHRTPGLTFPPFSDLRCPETILATTMLFIVETGSS